jgi:hypothetical protein
LSSVSNKRRVPPLPRAIAGISVPQDDVAAKTWRWAQLALPEYLLTHSVRCYCWGAAIAAGEALTFDRQVMWTASLMHDYALTQIPRNTMCFEVEGAEIARSFLGRAGLDPDAVDRAAIAIILHMRAGVTLADGVESVLLDRATALDVQGDGYELVDAIRPEVIKEYPRGPFDRLFLNAMKREVAVRPTCGSNRLLNDNDLAGWMARSPWRSAN